MAKTTGNAMKYYYSIGEYPAGPDAPSTTLCPSNEKWPDGHVLAASTLSNKDGMNDPTGAGYFPCVHDGSLKALVPGHVTGNTCTVYAWATGESISGGWHPGEVAYVLTENLVFDYQVQVQMGTVQGAGTDADVYIALQGANGSTSPQLLDNDDTNDFEAGGLYTYDLYHVDSVGTLTSVQMHHEGGASASEMYVEWIKVTDRTLN
ncbi:PLAT/LH2 domain-containing protein, partial [Nonomuraea sp. NPDC004297]